MSLRPRSLFLKIFLWFCLTVGLSSVLVTVVAVATGTQPFARRWLSVTQDLYAHSAADFYSTGGAPALERYLEALRSNSGIEGHLIDAQGNDVLGAPFPIHAQRAYREARRSGKAQFQGGRSWTAASMLESPQGAVFVMEANPLDGFFNKAFLRPALLRIAGASLLVAFCCLLLARHITQPILILQSAAARMSAGDLSVRTLPALRGRTDELASMAAAFDSMAARLEALLQSERQMLADISHELRSPLTRIGVSLELLRRGETDVIEPMQADLDRLNGMIGQILELIRFELAEAALVPGPVNLEAVVEDVVEASNREGRGRAISVVLAAGSGPFLVSGEEAPLRSCIENIVRNALQHTAPGGRIHVGLEAAEPGRIAVRVDDNGPGVPEDALPHLFTPFFRVTGGNETHPHGTGLGLSVSARVVARYGGSIGAANRHPNGLSVLITLPRASDRQARPANGN